VPVCGPSRPASTDLSRPSGDDFAVRTNGTPSGCNRAASTRRGHRPGTARGRRLPANCRHPDDEHSRSRRRRPSACRRCRHRADELTGTRCQTTRIHRSQFRRRSTCSAATKAAGPGVGCVADGCPRLSAAGRWAGRPHDRDAARGRSASPGAVQLRPWRRRRALGQHPGSGSPAVRNYRSAAAGGVESARPGRLRGR
jgi:hypothetical protein